LPLIRHQLVIPCLNPRHEKALTQIRGHAYGSQFDFVYVGNNNFANFIAVKWLLTEVFPFLNEPPPRIAFVGRIKELVRQMDQRLHEKYKHYFVGSIPDIAIYYSASFPYQAKAGCPTITGRRRTREAPVGMAPALSWS
jgi:hypothetical protein